MASYIFNPFTGALTPASSTATIPPASIVDADVNASAAIAGTKVAPNFGAQTVITTGSGLVGTATSLTTLYSGAGKFQVASNDATTVQSYAFSSTGVDYSATLELSRARGTQASPTIVANGDFIGQINFAGYNTNFQRGATIYALVDGEPGTAGDTTDMPGKLIFATSSNGSATPTTRMSIDSAGAVTLAGTLDVPLGAAATPSLTFTGDLNTGIFSPGADQVAISTNGTQRINIEADGDINIDGGGVFYDATNNRLAIGTTSPTDLLSVGTLGTSTNAIITLGSSTSSSGQIYFGDGTGNDRYRGYIEYTHSNDCLALATAGTERARIDSSGRLLVGTSTANANGGVLQLTSGITFPATAVAASDANTLDDYEEGTWTLTGISASTNENKHARYIKVGDQVTCFFSLETNTSTLTIGSTISGFPFSLSVARYFIGGTWGQYIYSSGAESGDVIINNGSTNVAVILNNPSPTSIDGFSAGVNVMFSFRI